MVENYVRFLEEEMMLKRVEADALPMAKYMKGQFDFYGVKSPLRKSICQMANKKFPIKDIDEVKEVVNILWTKSFRELQYAAIDLLVRKKKGLKNEDLPWIEELIESKSWWDTVDGLAPNVAGYLFDKDRAILTKYVHLWRSAPSIWLKRSSLICQLRFKDTVDTPLLFETIDYLCDSKEFFVNKAAGWALRQYSKFEPVQVRDYIGSRSLHPLVVREGSKYI